MIFISHLIDLVEIGHSQLHAKVKLFYLINLTYLIEFRHWVLAFY